MAGKRQHYVPRLLQRGFLTFPSNGGERTWLHRAGVPSRCVGIRDVGVQDWFYSRKGLPGERTLDDAITDFEHDLAKDVARLRSAEPGTKVDSTLASQTVVHLVMRTAHLRQTLATGITSVFQELQALFSDPTRLNSMLGITGPSLSSSVVEVISNRAEELVSAGLPAPLSERLMWFFTRERGDQLVSQMIEPLALLFPTMFTGLAAKVRYIQNSLVEKPLDDHGWVAKLTKFQWSVEAATDLILPDAVALARGPEGRFGPLLFPSGRDAAVALLPVAHNRMLVGRRDPAEPVDLAEFNSHAAANCEDFFIGARPFDAEMLSAQIGTGPAQSLVELIAEAVRQAEHARSHIPDTIEQAQSRELGEQEFSFNVTLADFGDETLAQEYGDILRRVIGALSQEIPLYDLDGITIAVDYGKALAELDRGDPGLPPVTSTALEYGVGVAMPVTVVRDGKQKKHIVIAAGIANGWKADDPDIRSESLHLLINMLAGISYAVLYANVPSFQADTMARELHLAVAQAPANYWSAREAAFVGPDQGSRYADLVVEGLAHAKNAIDIARSRMADDSDVEEAFTIGLRYISAVLSHAADWVGHRDGLPDGYPFKGNDLSERLAVYGLEHWILLFGRDLAACYADRGALDLSVLRMLSRHVERLFWCFGIYCWPEGDRVRCVVSDRELRLPKMELDN